jgi:hypothetical protein
MTRNNPDFATSDFVANNVSEQLHVEEEDAPDTTRDFDWAEWHRECSEALEKL